MILDVKLKKSYISHEIIFENEFDKDCTKYTSVLGELKQVIVNLINNAIDALESNHNETNYINTYIYCDTKVIIIKIKDNGGGIDEQIINSLFEPYSSTKLEKNGSGLGLYMSKMIIEKHLQGTIRGYNEKDGAVFEVVLKK